MAKQPPKGQGDCRFIRYRLRPQTSTGWLDQAVDPEIAIDRKQLRTVLDSLESFSGE